MGQAIVSAVWPSFTPSDPLLPPPRTTHIPAIHPPFLYGKKFAYGIGYKDIFYWGVVLSALHGNNKFSATPEQG